MKKRLAKLSVTDVLTVLGFIAIAIFVASFFIKKSAYVDVEILVTNDNIFYTDPTPPYWYQEKISAGAEEKDAIGGVVARVINIVSYEDEENKRDVYIKATVKASYDGKNEQYSFRGNPLLIGSPIVIHPGKVLIKGIVTSVAGEDDMEQEMTVKTRAINPGTMERAINPGTVGWNWPEMTTDGIDPLYVENIKVGDTVTDIEGNPIAEVLKKETTPAKRITTDSQGNTHLVKDPYLVEAYLTLKLRVRQTQSAYYYMNKYKVKVSEQIPLYFKNNTQQVEILEILDESKAS